MVVGFFLFYCTHQIVEHSTYCDTGASSVATKNVSGRDASESPLHMPEYTYPATTAKHFCFQGRVNIHFQLEIEEIEEEGKP